MTTSRATLWLLLALALAQALYFYPQLPPQVASHFAADGQPNGWMSRGWFVVVNAAMALLIALVFVGVAAIPWPDGLVNLPHRDHWLAPGRRAETWRTIRRFLDLFACATLLFLLVVFQMTIDANLDGGDGSLPAATLWWLLGGYLVVTTFLTVRLVLRFRRLPAEAP